MKYLKKLKSIILKEKNQKLFFLFAIFTSMLILNFLTPLIADDYSYSLTVNRERALNLLEILIFQKKYYLTWGGRQVAHTIAQVFLMGPKWIFNFANSFIYTLIVYYVYKFSQAFSKKEKPYLILLIHFILYFVPPVFGQNTLWLVGSCNYIWTVAIMLTMIDQYLFHQDAKDSILRLILIFLFGILSGWTNENTAFGFITILLGIIVMEKLQKKVIQKWQISGLMGTIMGFIIMIVAPGNYARSSQFVDNDFIIIKWIKRFLNCTSGLLNYCLPLIIALIILTTIYIYNHKKINEWVYIFLVGTIFSIYPMILSPEFPERSWFGIIVHFTIAVMILASDLDSIKKIFKPIMMDICIILGVLYISNYISLAMDIYSLKVTWNERIIILKENKNEVKALEPFWTNNPKNPNYRLADISKEVDDWPNIEIASYYGVAGVKQRSEEEHISE